MLSRLKNEMVSFVRTKMMVIVVEMENRPHAIRLLKIIDSRILRSLRERGLKFVSSFLVLGMVTDCICLICVHCANWIIDG